jgi:pre-60S factor REI1
LLLKSFHIPLYSTNILYSRVIFILIAQQSHAIKEQEDLKYQGNCVLCDKSYSSENAFKNHLASKKHKENEIRQQKVSSKDTASSPEAATPAPSIDTSKVIESEQLAREFRRRLNDARTEASWSNSPYQLTLL